MTFAARDVAAEPTHKLVTRDLPGVKDGDPAGGVTAENRAVGVLLEYGDAVHLRVDSKHGQFETIRSEFARVPESEQVFVGSERVYRASLPGDRPLVESVLEISAGDTAEWVDRTFYLDAFAILTDESWLYHSIPHETHIRECNASEHDELVAALNETLESVPGSAVVPADGFVSWTIGGVTYELDWDSLHRYAGADSHAMYDLERLQRVCVQTPEAVLRLDWSPASAESLLQRAWWWVVNSESATPPTRVRVPDGERANAVLDAFDRLRSALDYSYEVGNSDRSSDE
ncbi:hypothetical protein HALLA_16405 [Halostagnicola larsenii XH-48]|uniref:Uncharacterized protein n=1 Tax=Halostagnicola larsenii XH-48 TaxID=797299 RepID=W0JUR6_9EURY|nr:hypothetical protein [Halostagnicola larsenii]AHG01097.1 hypothetical protein HALLA_16405 [Halostagnicola larsenii XH-48]